MAKNQNKGNVNHIKISTNLVTPLAVMYPSIDITHYSVDTFIIT